MQKKISKEKITVIIVCTALLLGLSFIAGMIYNFLLKPKFGLQYSNLFFMISFILIFFSIAYIYHVWISKIQGHENH
jgi:predicted membrane-bound spermidine synthase